MKDLKKITYWKFSKTFHALKFFFLSPTSSNIDRTFSIFMTILNKRQKNHKHLVHEWIHKRRRKKMHKASDDQEAIEKHMAVSLSKWWTYGEWKIAQIPHFFPIYYLCVHSSLLFHILHTQTIINNFFLSSQFNIEWNRSFSFIERQCMH